MGQKRLSLTIHRPEKIYPTLSRIFRDFSGFKVPFHLQSNWLLALFEAIQNAFQHGGAKKARQAVRVELRLDAHWLQAKIFDRGPGLNLKGRGLKVSAFGERGRGLPILRQLTDTLRYQKGKKENYLLLKKKILPPEKRYRFTDLLSEMSHRLSEAPNLQKIYDLILEKLIEVFNVERASIMIYDPHEAALKVAAARGISPDLFPDIRVKKGEGISGDVFRNSRPLLVEDLKKRRLPRRRGKYQTHSFLSAPLILSPLKVGEETLGVINLTDRRDGGPFTKRDLKLLTAISQQAAAFVKIGRLLERLRAAERVTEDLAVVREIQTKLLPEEIASPPQAMIAGQAILNERGGGDYYDVVKDPQGFYLVVADVSGHSLASALTMVNFRSAFRMFSPQYPSPPALLQALNSVMFEDLKKAEHFICVSLVRFYPDKGELIFAGAGAVPLFLYGEGRKDVRMCPSQGFPLGIDPKAKYEGESFRLGPREGFIQCTDGVVDLPLKPQGVLGLEGIKKLLLSHQHYPPAEMIARLRIILRKKMSIRPPPDDITVLVTKMK